MSETGLIFGFGGKHQFNSYLIVTLLLPVKPHTLINTQIYRHRLRHTHRNTNTHFNCPYWKKHMKSLDELSLKRKSDCGMENLT